ncbi:agmatine deiminase family protein [Malonomonas rubra]|uniref:agmatine deiminase family protein n=1 Tax=Malonomonas rubra TaxID=57040 RepID=UPI0026EE0311|nr:agmatine deiminase family protein [Malonomonas rubra]
MNTLHNSQIRLPAEWEPQDAILIAWPHADSDWQPILEEISAVYVELSRQITAYQTLLIATPEPEIVSDRLDTAGIDRKNIQIVKVPTNDTWSRDFGPITVLRDNRPLLLDFGFNGWGLKFPADKDNQVTTRLHAMGIFGKTEKKTLGLILEGGSIESDGAGTILTTSECLLNANRNPQLDKIQIETTLTQVLGAKQIHWLDHGFLTGDDTDSHIDTLARLCPTNTITYTRCDNPEDEHYSDLQKMEQQLHQLRTPVGEPYRLIPLPWPKPSYDEAGERLPATYANYLVINGAVLVPTYDDPADQKALHAVSQAYPDRKIIGIDSRPVIWQHGSLHCISMQIPKGVLP